MTQIAIQQLAKFLIMRFEIFHQSGSGLSPHLWLVESFLIESFHITFDGKSRALLRGASGVSLSRKARREDTTVRRTPFAVFALAYQRIRRISSSPKMISPW